MKSQKKIVSVNFSRVLFTLLDFFTFEDGPNRLSQNVGTELPLYTAQYPGTVQISHYYLAMQALV
jgi:hypothetical protein